MGIISLQSQQRERKCLLLGERYQQNQSPNDPENGSSFHGGCFSWFPPQLKGWVCSRCPASFCQPEPSLRAQTGFLGNSWPISVCPDSGFSELRWLFRSNKYAVVLGAGERGSRGVRSEVRMRSPLQALRAAKQQAARQDKNRHGRRRKRNAWEIIDIPLWIQVGLRLGTKRTAAGGNIGRREKSFRTI